MGLKKYQSKRNLATSGEPEAKLTSSHQKLHFVIQKHDASHLHYDFRLEAEGVLKSWAIPKGPSINPKDKRLAIQVEDHPYNYKDFEGVIAQGYGAGTVMIWDEGTYQVGNDSARDSEKKIIEGLKKGELHFYLKGKKLEGEFSLIRINNANDSKSQWLLIKKNDAFASKKNILLEDYSTVSGKKLADIAEKKSLSSVKEILKKAPKSKIPSFIAPMKATLVDKPFDDEEWFFEIKWDGFRSIAVLKDKKVTLYSRYEQIFNDRFPEIAENLKKIPFEAVLDGEIIALDENHKPSFQLLQNIQKASPKKRQLLYYVFDILFYQNYDLRTLPLLERKIILKELLAKASAPLIKYSDHVIKNGKKFFEICVLNHLEGMVGKHQRSLYLEGKRSKEWVKVKQNLRQEAIICGFTEPKGGRKDLGALILGLYQNKELKFIGHCGSGFTDEMLKSISQTLKPLIQKNCPFQTKPKTNGKVTWVKPKFLCEVSFSEWTIEGSMRQPVFLGLREDKPAKSVTIEVPTPSEEVTKQMKKEKNEIKKSDQKFTHLDKIYWPKEQITKGDLIHYYSSIAKWILPYLKDRPQSLKRHPNGIEGESFFQKDLIHHPDWIKTYPIEHEEKVVNYLLIQDKASLLYAVNLGCIEINPLLSKITQLDYPDFLVLDLDPEDIDFEAVILVAQVIHEILEEIGIEGYCKTSGATGLHICLPLNGKYSYLQAKQFAEIIARIAHERIPSFTSLERSPKKRQKKVYIDFLQNNFGQTITAPYSVRPCPQAPVSCPLDWQEVKKGLNPADFTIFNIQKRIEEKKDFFKSVLGKAINMEKALKKLKIFR